MDSNIPNWQKLRNPDFLHTFKQRTKIIKAIRQFFDLRGFWEVESPRLVKAPGLEPHLHPFKTSITLADGKKDEAYLITSPEYHMKMLLCGGLEKIYQLTTSFRDQEASGSLHNPEFTILEWYRVNTNYMGIAVDLEHFIHFIYYKLTQKSILSFGDFEIDLTPPFEYLSVAESFRKFLGLDLDLLISDKIKFIKSADSLDYDLNMHDSWEDIYFKLFLTYVEPQLGMVKPTILFDYPASMAALARLKKDDERWAERFELFIGGVEIANAFSELTDWSAQLNRFKDEQGIRQQNGSEILPIDYKFIDALKTGLPECGGIALGVDRLIMVLLGKKQLNEVIFFPGKDIF